MIESAPKGRISYINRLSSTSWAFSVCVCVYVCVYVCNGLPISLNFLRDGWTDLNETNCKWEVQLPHRTLLNFIVIGFLVSRLCIKMWKSQNFTISETTQPIWTKLVSKERAYFLNHLWNNFIKIGPAISEKTEWDWETVTYIHTYIHTHTHTHTHIHKILSSSN